jgi:hypothetical protein
MRKLLWTMAFAIAFLVIAIAVMVELKPDGSIPSRVRTPPNDVGYSGDVSLEDHAPASTRGPHVRPN